MAFHSLEPADKTFETFSCTQTWQKVSRQLRRPWNVGTLPQHAQIPWLVIPTMRRTPSFWGTVHTSTLWGIRRNTELLWHAGNKDRGLSLSACLASLIHIRWFYRLGSSLHWAVRSTFRYGISKGQDGVDFFGFMRVFNLRRLIFLKVV